MNSRSGPFPVKIHPKGTIVEIYSCPRFRRQRQKQREQTATRNDCCTTEVTTEDGNHEQRNKVFNRYCHMFSEGELHELTVNAARELRLEIGSDSEISANRAVEIVQSGWERSNNYIEVRQWRR